MRNAKTLRKRLKKLEGIEANRGSSSSQGGVIECALTYDGVKAITLQHIYELLRDMKYEVKVLEEIAEKARKVIERMLEMS